MEDTRHLVVRGPNEGDAIWFLDNLLSVKTPERGDATFSVLEATLPEGSRTPFHRHTGEDEAFFVLEGEITFFVEGKAPLRVGPGAYVHVPRGVAHGFRTETPIRMITVAGARGFATMVRAAGSAATRYELPAATPPDVERLGAVAAAHGIELLGPLPE